MQIEINFCMQNKDLQLHKLQNNLEVIILPENDSIGQEKNIVNDYEIKYTNKEYDAVLDVANAEEVAAR